MVYKNLKKMDNIQKVQISSWRALPSLATINGQQCPYSSFGYKSKKKIFDLIRLK